MTFVMYSWGVKLKSGRFDVSALPVMPVLQICKEKHLWKLTQRHLFLTVHICSAHLKSTSTVLTICVEIRTRYNACLDNIHTLLSACMELGSGVQLTWLIRHHLTCMFESGVQLTKATLPACLELEQDAAAEVQIQCQKRTCGHVDSAYRCPPSPHPTQMENHLTKQMYQYFM